MMSDWLERLLTTCPAHLNEMGHLNEVLGIRRRWRQNRDAWESHCQRSRQVVLAAAARCPRKERAVVLGSGWLHDVPLAELAGTFAAVTLVDLFHPRLTRQAAKAFPNVDLVEADVTGTLQRVHAAAASRTPLPRAEPTLFLGESIDLVVSLNLMSQLPCMPETYLRQCRSHDERAIAAYARDVIAAHMAYLARLPGVVALVSDVTLEYVSASGATTPRGGTLYGCPMPYRGDEWWWELVSPTPAVRGKRLRVVGVVDVKDTASVRLDGG